MAYQYRIAQIVSDASGERPDPTVADGNWVWVCALNGVDRIGNRCLIKVAVPDGTAPDNNTLAILSRLADGALNDDVDATALTGAQIAAIKTRLTNWGFNVSQFDGDGVDNRRKLLVFVLRRVFGWRVADLRQAIDAFTVDGG